MREQFWWLNQESQSMLERGYLLPNQTVQEKLRIITDHASQILGKPELSDKFYHIFSQGWASLSSPIWANFGENRGLPISCFSSFCGDSISHIYDTVKEVALMTQSGGGTAGCFSDLRGKGSPIKGGGKSSGAISFIEVFDTTIKNVSQSGVRRGGFAAYLDINHPEILDFLRVKDKDSTMQSINTAVNVDDAFMEKMISGDEKCREVWASVLKSRREKGIPYIHFIDNANNQAPQWYKDKGLKINQSNLCSEIELSTSEDESLVCCLSSLNLYTYDEWKDTDTVSLMIQFLDAVMQDFINKTENKEGFKRARKFAISQRALGLGCLGWSSYLQANSIPFDSLLADALTEEIFSSIQKQSIEASKALAKEFGEPSLLKGYGMRNSTLLAIAPTTSSSSILGGVSPSIEPYKSNYFIVGLAKGSFPRKNVELKRVLELKGKDTEDVWKSILNAQGSVQHLSFLSDEEKDVFKTFSEISPSAIIRQAAIRGKFIDQGQSLNLLIPHTVPIKDINGWMIDSWKLGLKALYYQRGTSVSKEALTKLLECSTCEG